MNEVAQWLKDEIALTQRARSLGIARQITHDEATIAYRRAAEEIENLCIISGATEDQGHIFGRAQTAVAEEIMSNNDQWDLDDLGYGAAIGILNSLDRAGFRVVEK